MMRMHEDGRTGVQEETGQEVAVPGQLGVRRWLRVQRGRVW